MTTTCVSGGSPVRLETPLQLVTPPAAAPGEADRPMSPSDTLVHHLATDLDGSFEQVVRTFQDRLYSFAHRLCGNREDAEEVAQDAFVRAYRALKTWPAERIRSLSLQAWLYRITLNLARNRLRGRGDRRFVSIDNGGPDGETARRAWEASDEPEARPDSRYERGQTRADIASLVQTLPERYRAPLILRYVEGLRLEEVADVLKQPLGTAKSNVHRAVNLLRKAITDSRRVKRS